MNQIKIFFLLSSFIITLPLAVHAQEVEKSKTDVQMYKTPNCSCCDKWAVYMEENGFSVTLSPSDTLAAVKTQHGVPKDLRSCHIALIDGYVVEGHVPVESVNKLLEERPEATGIAVPNMPKGSPGMGEDGPPYEVFLFDEEGDRSVYGQYQQQ